MTQPRTLANCLAPMGFASDEMPREESSVNLRQLWTSSCPTIDLTPGEYVDRLTIAEVKAKKCSNVNAKKALEQAATLFNLSYQLRCNVFAAAAIARPVPELMDVHTQLWDVENEIRELDKVVHQTYDGELRDWDRVSWSKLSEAAKASLIRYLQLARLVYVLNDKRTALKKQVDEAFGMTSEVKEYSSYASDNPSPTS